MLAERDWLAKAVCGDVAHREDRHAAAELFSRSRQDRCHPALQRRPRSPHNITLCKKVDKCRSSFACRYACAGSVTLRDAQPWVFQDRSDQASKMPAPSCGLDLPADEILA